MGLFNRKSNQAQPAPPATTAEQVSGRQAYCTVCNAYRQFSRCWRRLEMIRKCTGCGLEFDNAAGLYQRFQPSCPRCAEFLEHPGFVYGLCDGCGSKFELVEGAKPGLLPNKKQRDKMNLTGKSWSRD